MQRTVIVGSILGFVTAAAVTVIALSAALPASGARAPQEDPARFLTRVVGFVVTDDYASAWPTLHPAHQDVAPRDEYVSCERLSPVGWKLRSATVVKVAKRLRAVPGSTESVPLTAVTLRLRIVNMKLQTEGAFTHTFTAVAVGSRWTWILTPTRYELYRADACGAGYSPAPPDA